MSQDFESDGFSAVIEQISLFDYMQLMMMTQKNKTIEINNGNYSGIIQIIKGKISFAETSSKKTGMDAVFEIMLLNTGNFRELKKQDKLVSNIKDNGNILLQVAEYMDKIKYSEAKANKVIENISIEEQISSELIKSLTDSNLLNDWAKNISGICNIAILSKSSKVISNISFYKENDKEKELFLPSSHFIDLVKDSVKIFNISKLGVFKEFILESDTHYILMNMINPNYFLQIIISKKHGNMGSLKLKIKKFTPSIEKYLIFKTY